MPTPVRVLLAVGVVLALAVVVLGAYVRLKGAGLGCPDWPGCYGQLVGVPATVDGAEIDSTKAWIELAHRYLAGTLGLVVLAALIAGHIGQVARLDRVLLIVLAVMVILQAALGALTVTQLLKPVIVTGHLLGGMLIVAILIVTNCRAYAVPGFQAARLSGAVRILVLLCGVAFLCQVALGGWVSSNYAGLACGSTVLKCQGSWLPAADASAFALDRELGLDSAGVPITAQALATVQWLHRVGAFFLSVLIGTLAVILWLQARRGQAVVLGALLLTQVLLGIYIVTASLPLFFALLHNALAALLCSALVAVAVAGWAPARHILHD